MRTLRRALRLGEAQYTPVMDFARAWLPKPRTRYIPLVLGAVFFGWTLLAITGPAPNILHPGYGPQSHHYPLPGSHSHPITFSPPSGDTLWSSRASQVRDAFLHAYRGYTKYAAPHDELLPTSDSYVNK